MRRFTASITAATVAIAVGLVIASVAGAARAAEYENMQARASAQNSVAATEAELAAYKERLKESYAQLTATYALLQSQDAQAAASASSDGANVRAAVDLGGGATNVAAYSSATAELVALAMTPSVQSTTSVAPRSTPPPLPTRATPANTPLQTASTVRTATGLYCWYDHDGKYVCEDHPQGQ